MGLYGEKKMTIERYKEPDGLEPTDIELEVAALIEEIGQKIDEFITLRKANEDTNTQRLLEIDEKIERFVKLTKDAGNLKMGNAVKKRWMKIKKSTKVKK